MTLAFVSPEEVARTSATISVLLYGPEGVGKSCAAGSAPGPILYLNADAPDAIRFARQKYSGKEFRELRITGRESIEQAFLYARETGDVQTVVWDSMGSIYSKVLRDIARDDKHPTQPEYGDTQTFISRYIEAFLELPLNLVLVAHDMNVQTVNSEGVEVPEIHPFMGTKQPGFGAALMRPLAVVAYCGVIPANDEGPARYVGQLFHGGGRRGKDRTSVLGGDGATDLDLSAWAHLVAATFGSTKEKK